MREQGPSWAKKPLKSKLDGGRVALMVPREVVVSTFVLTAEIIPFLARGTHFSIPRCYFVVCCAQVRQGAV